MATELPDTVRAALAELPHSPDGWWKQADGEEYEALAAELLQLGIGAETVIDVLSRAYAAAAHEFGC